jgi:enolase
MEIIKVHALEILDSRGNPTLKVTVETSSGAVGSFSVPPELLRESTRLWNSATGIKNATEAKVF